MQCYAEFVAVLSLRNGKNCEVCDAMQCDRVVDGGIVIE